MYLKQKPVATDAVVVFGEGSRLLLEDSICGGPRRKLGVEECEANDDLCSNRSGVARLFNSNA